MKNTLVVLFSFLVTIQAYSQKTQDPKPPFPYQIEEVTFKNTQDSIQLFATLTIPSSDASSPAVVLISGSGAQDRNSEIFGHKPFWVIADYLSRRGIAVLRVDDRGAGDSEGNHMKASISDFQRDTEAALAFLQKHNAIDKENIGLIGHSLGGVIAPLVAADQSDVAFVIMLAGPGINGDSIMLHQKAAAERQMGIAEPIIQQGQANFGKAYALITASDDSPQDLRPKLKAYFSDLFQGMIPEQQLDGLVMQLTIPWMVDFIRYNPADVLPKVNCPVLAVNGELDFQVLADENLQAIKAALEHNPDVQTKKMAGMNHLFQVCKVCDVREYATLEETFSPEVLRTMHDWISVQTAKE